MSSAFLDLNVTPHIEDTPNFEDLRDIDVVGTKKRKKKPKKDKPHDASSIQSKSDELALSQPPTKKRRKKKHIHPPPDEEAERIRKAEMERLSKEQYAIEIFTLPQSFFKKSKIEKSAISSPTSSKIESAPLPAVPTNENKNKNESENEFLEIFVEIDLVTDHDHDEPEQESTTPFILNLNDTPPSEYLRQQTPPRFPPPLFPANSESPTTRSPLVFRRSVGEKGDQFSASAIDCENNNTQGFMTVPRSLLSSICTKSKLLKSKNIGFPISAEIPTHFPAGGRSPLAIAIGSASASDNGGPCELTPQNFDWKVFVSDFWVFYCTSHGLGLPIVAQSSSSSEESQSLVTLEFTDHFQTTHTISAKYHSPIGGNHLFSETPLPIIDLRQNSAIGNHFSDPAVQNSALPPIVAEGSGTEFSPQQGGEFESREQAVFYLKMALIVRVFGGSCCPHEICLEILKTARISCDSLALCREILLSGNEQDIHHRPPSPSTPGKFPQKLSSPPSLPPLRSFLEHQTQSSGGDPSSMELCLELDEFTQSTQMSNPSSQGEPTASHSTEFSFSRPQTPAPPRPETPHHSRAKSPHHPTADVGEIGNQNSPLLPARMTPSKKRTKPVLLVPMSPIDPSRFYRRRPASALRFRTPIRRRGGGIGSSVIPRRAASAERALNGRRGLLFENVTQVAQDENENEAQSDEEESWIAWVEYGIAQPSQGT